MLAASRRARHACLNLATILTLILTSLASLTAAPHAYAAAPTDLFISEYIEGSSNNKALEIYNGTGAAIDLAAGQFLVQMYFNGSATAGLSINLSDAGNDIVASGDVFVLAQSSANAAILAQADLTNGAGWFNGDDAVVLRKGGAAGPIIDVIGQIGLDPGTEWGSGLVSTADNTLMRQSDVCAGDTDGSNAFDPAPEWDGFANDTFSNLGSHTASCAAGDAAPSVTGTTPASGATDIAPNSNITVSFSESVNLAAGAITVECPTGTTVASNAGESGVTSVVIDPAADLPDGASCAINVAASGVSDADGDDPPDTLEANFSASFSVATLITGCEAPFTPIYAIQGSGASAAITGTITTQGVVVGDFEGTASASGFYMQDTAGDGDSATSDGIFVFTGSSNLVSIGDIVRVTGFARERFNQTTINGSDSNTVAVPTENILNCGTGSVLPTDVSMPFADAGYPERFEGMLVRFPQPLVIAEYFNYDRFGEIVLALPLDGEPRPFSSTAIDEPGAAANARTLANSLRRITLDDAQSAQNPPTLRHPNGSPFSLANRFRGGDTVQNTVGVLGFDFSLYRVFPTGPADYTAVNPRPAAPEPVGGSIRVAAMNTLNFFVTLDTTANDNGPGPCGGNQNLDCRGADADQPDEFTRQRDKLLTALSGLDADIIGLNELENTPGAEPLASIVSGMPGYAYIDTGPIGTDAIKVGMIYRTSAVTPVGGYQILDSTDDPRFIDTKSRPSLAQTFEVNATGERFTVAVNHFKSKGSACADVGDPDLGDGQANCSQTRRAAAEALVDWLATDPTGSGDPDFIIMGDLNSYAQEDTIDEIKAGSDDIAGTADDFTNLIAQFQGPFAYSYTFDGQAGYLDHALASASLVPQVTGATEWHINSDEPDVLDYDTSFKPAAQEALYEVNQYRTSDHDPVIVGLNLDSVAPVTTASVSGTQPPGCPPGCFTGSATVTLTTNEPATTQYRVNGGAWVVYTGPFVVSSEGANLVEFFSTDSLGNVEVATSITVIVTTFPTRPVLDNFDRRNGAIGSSWTGSTGGYSIRSNRVQVFGGGPIYWRADSAFGTSQEAYVTLTNVATNGREQDLLLKVQGGNAPDWTKGAIEVLYDARNGNVRVETFRPGSSWKVYAPISATFQNGDQLGARALADGTVRIYKNCVLIGVVTLDTADQNFFNGKGGRIGLWFIDAQNALIDNFGGGTVVP